MTIERTDATAMIAIIKTNFIQLGGRTVKIIKDHPFFFTLYVLTVIAMIGCVASPYVISDIRLGVGIGLGGSHLLALVYLLDDKETPQDDTIRISHSSTSTNRLDTQRSDDADMALAITLSMNETQLHAPGLTPLPKSKDNVTNLLQDLYGTSIVPHSNNFAKLRNNPNEMQNAVMVVDKKYLFFRVREKQSGYIQLYILENMGTEWHSEGFQPMSINSIDQRRHPLYQLLQEAIIIKRERELAR